MKTLIIIGILFSTFLNQSVANPFDRVETVKKMVNSVRVVKNLCEHVDRDGLLALGERTNFALDILIRKGVRELRRQGHDAEATRIEEEWTTTHFGSLMRLADLGDFDPLSEWLADAYKSMLQLLGPTVMEWLHLDDINTLNYAIPVVFRPCIGPWTKGDYQRHFVPFMGVVAYWTTWGVCVTVSSGIGVLFCSPIGSVSEWVMAEYLAPDLAIRVFEGICE